MKNSERVWLHEGHQRLTLELCSSMEKSCYLTGMLWSDPQEGAASFHEKVHNLMFMGPQLILKKKQSSSNSLSVWEFRIFPINVEIVIENVTL